MNAPHRPQPWFVAGDLDGFFGLAIDNLIQFLLILGLCGAVLGFPVELLLRSVLPGAALSVVFGNLYYAKQAQDLSARTGRTDVTALPYGINTVSLFAFVFLVMLPVKLEGMAQGLSDGEAAHTAFRVGLAACFLSGAIELLGAPVADFVRRSTPRAALLATLSGIAISFIAIDFAVRTFAMPLVALLPLAVILTTYFSGVRLPLRVPGGAWALGFGALAAWLLTMVPGASTPVSTKLLGTAFDHVGFYPPIPVLGDLYIGLTHPLTLQFLVPVIVPMALFNVLGSIQNLESAEAAGDSYPSAPSLVVNGIGSLVASAFGSCFPTTIYIGHPGWKALGARSGYSILNGVFFVVIALFGLSHAVSAIIPIEAGMAIVLGLFPAIAGWGVLILTQTLGAAGIAVGDMTLADKVLAAPGAFGAVGLNLTGMVALSQGFMLTCLVWSAASALLIDRKLMAAARFMLIGAALAFFGFIHAGTLSPAGGVYEIRFGSGTQWAIGYLLCAAFFQITAWWVKKSGQETPLTEEQLRR